MVTEVCDDTVKFSYYDESGQFCYGELPRQTFEDCDLKCYNGETFDMRVTGGETPELELLPKPDAETRYQIYLSLEGDEPAQPNWDDPVQVEEYRQALEEIYGGSNWGMGAGVDAE